MSVYTARNVTLKGFAPSSSGRRAKGKSSSDDAALMDVSPSTGVEHAQSVYRNSSIGKNEALWQQQQQKQQHEQTRRVAKFSPSTAVWDVPSPTDKTNAQTVTDDQAEFVVVDSGHPGKPSRARATEASEPFTPMPPLSATQLPATAAPARPPPAPLPRDSSVLIDAQQATGTNHLDDAIDTDSIASPQPLHSGPSLANNIGLSHTPVSFQEEAPLRQPQLSTTTPSSLFVATTMFPLSPPMINTTKTTAIGSYWVQLPTSILFDLLQVCILRGLNWIWAIRRLQRLLRLGQPQHNQYAHSKTQNDHSVLVNGRTIRKSSLAAATKPPKTVRGIPNYGQTCFFNSVLQAMASLPSFELYLHHILTTNNNNNGVGPVSDTNHTKQTEPTVTTKLRFTLGALNDAAESPNRTVKHLLRTIGKSHQQFQHRNEQQDAHELLQALMNLLIEEQQRLEKENDYENAAIVDMDDVDEKVQTKSSVSQRSVLSGDKTDLASSAASLSSLLWRLHEEQQQQQQQQNEQNDGDKDNQQQYLQRSVGPTNVGISPRPTETILASSATTTTAMPVETNASNTTPAEEKKSESLPPSPSFHSLTDDKVTGDEPTKPQQSLGQNQQEEEAITMASTNTSQHEQLGGRSIASTSTDRTMFAPSLADSVHLIVDGQDGGADTGLNADLESGMAHEALPAAMQVMLKTLSPITPTPLNGWMGSTLQCQKCGHIRPIPNAPFLDIPLVPTALSNYMHASMTTDPSNDMTTTIKQSNPQARFPSCTVQECMQEFTGIEQVSDVECMSCTLLQERQHWQEEVDMLRGAVKTLQQKKPTDSQDALVQELAQATNRLAVLTQLDPDDAESVLRPTTDGNAEWSDTEQSDSVTTFPTETAVVRADAWKRMVLSRLPTVLCLHIQRRYYNPHTDTMAKAAQHVDFSEILDASEFYKDPQKTDSNKPSNGTMASPTQATTDASQPQQLNSHKVLYKLQSVVEHRGNAHAGHYQTYRRDPNTNNENKWYLVSDQTVRSVSWERVQESQAYMLFYEAM